MDRTPRQTTAIIATLLALAIGPLMSVACGRKAPPRPPDLVRPRTIRDLEATPVTDGIHLTWTRPTETMDGGDMPDLDGVVVLRATLTEPAPKGKRKVDDLPFETRPLYTGKPWFLPAIIRWHRLADRLGL